MRLTEVTEENEALGGTTTIGIVIEAGKPTDTLFAHVWRKTFQFEKRFSRFIPESELSQFNSGAGLKTPASPEFTAVLRAAQELTLRTGGLFNPFVLPALQRAGYIKSAIERYSEDDSPDYTDRQIVSPEKLELTEGWNRIPHGTAIDLGGCGKGYLADELGSYLRSEGVAGYWINISGDIATYGHDASGKPIVIAIQNAGKDAATKATVVCPPERFGVATSGTLRRPSQTDSMLGHHIIDPRTGKAADTDIKLSTVCAPTALEADVLASCAVILGSKAAPKFLKTQSVPAWYIQYVDESGDLRQTSFGTNIIAMRDGNTHAS